jgi:hypothetical protein
MISDFKGENVNFMKSREVDGIHMVIKVGKAQDCRGET